MIVLCSEYRLFGLGKGEAGGDSAEIKIKDAEYTFRWCPSGEVKMFAPVDENNPESQKEFKIIRIDEGFWMLQSEVTRGLWKSVMGNDPSKGTIPSEESSAADNFPVDSISWDDCQKFLNKLNSDYNVPGYKFVLPTEVQWVYASRAGDMKNKDESFDSLAWFADNSDNRAHEVCQKDPNDWGLFDMHGNVAEWCLDWYDAGGQSSNSDKRRGYHGGSFMTNEEYYNQDSRFCLDEDTSNTDLGFRICLVPEY